MVVCLVYTTDAADAEGSNGGSGSGTGSGSAGAVDGASWCGKATLVTMEYGVLRLIASFLPMKGWCTILPTVFPGALHAVYEGRPYLTRLVAACKKSIAHVTEVAYCDAVAKAVGNDDTAMWEVAGILKKAADALEVAADVWEKADGVPAEVACCDVADAVEEAAEVLEEVADTEVAYGDATDAEGSTGGCGSGAGCGNAFGEVSEDQPVWMEKEEKIRRFGSDAKKQMVQTNTTEDDEGEEQDEECTVRDEFG